MKADLSPNSALDEYFIEQIYIQQMDFQLIRKT